MIRFPNSKTWARLSLVLVASASLMAQESGQISGTVKGQGGKALANARVSIKAPQLIQSRTVMTGVDGSYRVPLLPAGDYTISVSADGYMSAAASIRIGIGGRFTQDFPMRAIETKSTVVEVIASSATVDKSDTKSAANFSSEQLESFPAADRAFYGAAQLAPGVVTTTTGSISVRGGTSQSTVYTLNGASIGDDYQGQQYENRIVDDAIEDVQVIQSPLNARFGRTTGGILNVVSKSGGNDFSGSIRTYIARNDWRAWRPYQRENDLTDNKLSSRRYDVFFSGPIIKDRLWFAVSAVLRPPESAIDTLLQGENPADWAAGFLTSPGDLNAVFGVPEVPYTYDLGKVLSVSSKSTTYQGKLTFAINADHTIDYEHYEQENTTSNRNPYGVPIIPTVQSNSLSQKDKSSTNNYSYRGTFGSKIFLEARYSEVKSQAVFPSPNLPHVRWNNGGSQFGVFFPYGFNISPSPDARDNRSGNINLKVFAEGAGSHEIDAGIDYYQFRRGTSTQNGTLNRRFYVSWITPGAIADANLPGTAGFGPVGTDPYGNSVGFFAMNLKDSIPIFGGNPGLNGFAPVYQQFYGKDGTTTNGTTSFYVNDQWTLNSHWNVMAGLRVDREKVTNTDGSTILEHTAPVSPRLMLRYDINGDSARLVTFTAAKYVDDIRGGFTDAFVGKANTRWARFGWSAFATDDFGFVSYNALVNPANYGGPNGLGSVAGGPYQVFDAQTAIQGASGITNPFTYEFTLGYRRTFSNGSSMALTAVHKDFKNQFAITQDFDPSYVVLVTDPSGISTSQIGTFATRFGNSDILTRRYDALEMEFLGRLSPVWTVTGSYTYSRLTGNNEGGDSLSQGFRDNGPNGALFLRNWLLNPPSGFVGGAYSEKDFAPDGPLSSDRTHKLRLTTTARLPLGKGYVSYAFIANYDSGRPYQATASNSSQGSLFTGGLPSPKPSVPSSFTRYYSGRGAFRFNDYYSVDFKVAYQAPIVGRLSLIGNFTISNLFNNFMQGPGSDSNFGWTAAYTGSTLSRTAPIAVGNRATFGTDAQQYSNYIGARSFSASLGLRF